MNKICLKFPIIKLFYVLIIFLEAKTCYHTATVSEVLLTSSTTVCLTISENVNAVQTKHKTFLQEINYPG